MAFPENPIYKLINDPITGKLASVKSADGWFIPIDNENTMYQNYLTWVADGNTAEAAD